jgi:serine/threonine protein kinase
MGMDDKTVFQPAPQGSLRPGVRLNGMFEIERLIAEGGVGEVYKGVATATGDPVAIKLVRPEMASHPDVMALFRREANILHDLLHDAIPRYYVFSIEPELQRPYIAMEFVDGVSLQKRLSAGPMSSAEVRILLRRLGGALDAAHARGIVHRDISSDNIILPDGDPRRAKIVDFGIARAAQAREGTILGDSFAGKYNYVSPEQLGLAGGEVTPKSDMYSFGLVVAEALRGRPIDMAGTQAEVIEKRRRVPDLSDIDIRLRPLLTAMLAPDPRDRPASMAEVAAWGETGERTTLAPPLAAKPPAPARSGGRRKMMAAVLVVLAGAAAAAYVERDALRGALWAPVGSEPDSGPKLPPLPPPVSTPTPVATPSPVATPTSPPPATATPVQAETPSVQVLLEQLPPKPAQAELALGPLRAGVAARADLPPFDDPGGKGVALHATPGLPTGLRFTDLGHGRGALEGAPAAAGRFGFEIVAVSPAGKSARMKVTLDVSAAPPQPAQSVVDLAPATVGLTYSAGLPPFRSPEALVLRAEGLPDGLAFADLGGGLSQLAGLPAKAGKFGFEIVATAKSGAEARMKVNIEVAPQTVAAEPPPIVTPTPASPPTLAAFLRSYDGGPCFAVRQVQNDDLRVAALGAERAAFERFEGAFKAAFGREPQLDAQLVTPAQCPAAAILKSAAEGPAPRLALATLQVGTGQPLSGSIAGLSGRPLLLLAISDDGRAVKLRTQPSPGGDTASFNVALSGDATSIGKPQVLLALVSAKPLSGLDAFRAGPAADVARILGAQGREAGASAALAVFKLGE